MNRHKAIRVWGNFVFVVRALLPALLLASVASAQTHTHVGFRFIDPVYTMAPSCSDDASCNAEADKYLQAIGVYQAGNTTPTVDRGTSAAWKASLGFSADPTKPNPGELRAVYWNAGDLGLGRDMHCIKKDVNQTVAHVAVLRAVKYACYVTNFRVNLPNTENGNLFSGTPDIQASISRAALNQKPVATVAMEVTFTPVLRNLGLSPFKKGITVVRSNVEFIAFDETQGGVPFSPPLDTNVGVTVQPNHPGKASPGTCLACHGGHYVGSSDPGGARVEGGNFLPFNTSTANFAYSTDATLAQFSETAQRDAFRQLNQFVLDTQPSVTTINDLVNGWYAWCGGVGTAGCFIDEVNNSFIPDLPSGGGACGTLIGDRQTQTCGWATGTPVAPYEKPANLTHKVYQNVAAVYCRTCHVAMPGIKNVQQFNDWRGLLGNTHETPPLVQEFVTGNQMPFAEVPFNRYWNDTNAQNLFDSFFSTQPSACVSSCDACSSRCNVAEGQCMAGARSVADRQECIRDKRECVQGCSSSRPACVNRCSF